MTGDAPAAAGRVEMRKLDSGITLAVREFGPPSGRPVVMLHGFPENGATWRPVAEILASRGIRTVAPDLRGFGLSDAPRRVGAYRLDRLVEDVVELLRWFDEPVDAVGHDWGGALLWLVVERHPELVRAVTILNAPHALELRRALLRSRDQRRRSRYVLYFQLPWLPERRLRADDGALLARFFRKTYPADEVEAYQACWRRPGVVRGMLNWYRAVVRRPGPAAPIPGGARDVLLVTGELDELFGDEVIERSASRFPGVRHVVLPDTAHSPHRQHPSRLAELILDRP